MESDRPPHVSAGELHRETEAVLDRTVTDHERVLVTRDGKPVAALVPLEDLLRLEEAEDRSDAEAGDRAHAEWVKSREPAIPLEDLLRRYGIER